MRLRKLLRKIHRWVGVIASLWLLLLASTGYLLQHKEGFNLENKFIQSTTLLSWYGIGEQFLSFELNQNKVAQLDYQVYVDESPVLKLEKELIGVVEQGANIVLATENELHWFNQDKELVQSMDSLDGLPSPIVKIAIQDSQIYLKSLNGVFTLEGQLVDNIFNNWSTSSQDLGLKNQLLSNSSNEFVSWFTLLFDIHAGITTPSLLNDLAAFALIFLSLSGLIIFFKKSARANR